MIHLPTYEYLQYCRELRPLDPAIVLPTLPPETIDHIISYLQNATRTLCQCALTCRDWFPASQRYLLHDITISSRAQFDLFASRVLGDPRRVPDLCWVHHLRLIEAQNGPFAWALLNSVGCLTSLQSIDLQHIYRSAGTPAFSPLPCVTTLSIFQCRFFNVMELVPLFPQLSELRIASDCIWDSSKSLHPEAISDLRTLTLAVSASCFSAICTSFLRTPAAKSIISLDIRHLDNITMDGVVILGKLLRFLQDSLVNLSIPCHPYFADVVTLRYNNLRLLHVKASNWCLDMCTVWVVLATLISGIVSPLHRLEFSVDFSHSRYTKGDLERHIGMDAFDAALCGKNFAGLEQVKITFINLVDEEDHLLQDILKCLPRVNARSILCVDVQYESSDGANQAAEFTKWQNVPRNLCFRDDDPAKRSDATQGYRQRR